MKEKLESQEHEEFLKKGDEATSNMANARRA